MSRIIKAATLFVHMTNYDLFKLSKLQRLRTNQGNNQDLPGSSVSQQTSPDFFGKHPIIKHTHMSYVVGEISKSYPNLWCWYHDTYMCISIYFPISMTMYLELSYF
jgi:hypothetical protein